MADFENHILYVLPGCPYCTKVDRFLDEHGVQVEHRSVTQGTNRSDLVALGGKAQCPCLAIGSTALYESDDIIAYFRDRI